MRPPRIAQELDYTCGAACFASAHAALTGEILGEAHFARLLGTHEAGHTRPGAIVDLFKQMGFNAEMLVGAAEIRPRPGAVTFVTWWDVDAGHYSLVLEMNDQRILLMDPWAAREGLDTEMALADFLPLWRQRGSRVIHVWL